jgi:hypothetical protein
VRANAVAQKLSHKGGGRASGRALRQAGDAVSTAFSQLASGSAADLAPFPIASEIACAAVRIQHDVRAFERQQQLLVACVQGLEPRLREAKVVRSVEDGIEARR